MSEVCLGFLKDLHQSWSKIICTEKASWTPLWTQSYCWWHLVTVCGNMSWRMTESVHDSGGADGLQLIFTALAATRRWFFKARNGSNMLACYERVIPTWQRWPAGWHLDIYFLAYWHLCLLRRVRPLSRISMAACHLSWNVGSLYQGAGRWRRSAFCKDLRIFMELRRPEPSAMQEQLRLLHHSSYEVFQNTDQKREPIQLRPVWIGLERFGSHSDSRETWARLRRK